MSRISLRNLSREDIDWVYRACQDEEIQRWTLVPRPYTREHAEDFVTGVPVERVRWVIESDESSRAVGVISIHGVEECHASIGYWMAPQSRGQGFATEAIHRVGAEVMALIAHGGLDVVGMLAYVAVDNRASRRAVERAGFSVRNVQTGPAVRDLQPVSTCVYTLTLDDHGPPAIRTIR